MLLTENIFHFPKIMHELSGQQIYHIAYFIAFRVTIKRGLFYLIAFIIIIQANLYLFA